MESRSIEFLTRRLGREIRNPTFLRLPRIAGSSVAATMLADSAGNGNSVIIDGRHSVLHSESFAFQLMADLRNSGPKEIIVLGGTEEWQTDIVKAAEEYSLEITRVTL